MARRCLGKGTAKDKLVLDSALWHVLCAEEEKAGVPMEVEEHGAKFAKEKTVRVSYSSKAIPGGGFEYSEEFIKH